MYVRMVTNKLQPGKVDEWEALVREAIVPSLRNQKGFKGFVVMKDHAGNRGVGYSLWETEEDLRASEASAPYPQLIERLTAVLDGRPQRDVYEYVQIV
jgi:quinol monooxygenase YgiN